MHVVAGCMQLEVETAVLVCGQWSATTHTPTSGCCVHRWQSDVVELAFLLVMDSCTPSVATMPLPVIQHQVVLIVLNGMCKFTVSLVELNSAMHILWMFCAIEIKLALA